MPDKDTKYEEVTVTFFGTPIGTARIKKITMWGHWRGTMVCCMILWAILKWSAPATVTWGWLFYPMGVISFVFMIVGIVRTLIRKRSS